MIKVVNPFNKKAEELYTAANWGCSCKCYTDDSNNEGKGWTVFSPTSKCGCNCQYNNPDNKTENQAMDKARG
ncbi:hypothetical protein G9F71_026405 [Clostridium sp. FP2]|uniref:hypothetical protein n=1 Tax=Clostridium sp. FP2 TaxID=2724481 RepID=UPI0013E999E0|nr:hypothetical protein [Clostridium sp. FP2]MBZ9626341.1 hypothetical protein [Clostridium sp. FP2]